MILLNLKEFFLQKELMELKEKINILNIGGEVGYVEAVEGDFEFEHGNFVDIKDVKRDVEGKADVEEVEGDVNG